MPTLAFTSARLKGTQSLDVGFSDDSLVSYSLMWLLDSCPEGFHPQTGERAFYDGRLELQWAHGGPASHFTAAWLSVHRPGVPRPDAAMVAAKPGRSATF